MNKTTERRVLKEFGLLVSPAGDINPAFPRLALMLEQALIAFALGGREGFRKAEAKKGAAPASSFVELADRWAREHAADLEAIGRVECPQTV